MQITGSFHIKNDSGRCLDAKIDLERNDLVLHSRSGGKTDNPRNPEYSAALRMILQRAYDSGLKIESAFVDSAKVQSLAINDRLILTLQEDCLPPAEKFKIMSSRIRSIGRSPGSKSQGNAQKRIKIRFCGNLGIHEIQTKLGLILEKSAGTDGALTAAVMEGVWDAIQKSAVDPKYSCDPSNETAPIKIPLRDISNAVSEISRSVTHDSLEVEIFLMEAGHQIHLNKNHEKEIWIEGGTAQNTHTSKERSPTLARAKKLHFIGTHGKLFCESCKIDPIEKYGPHGDACIEVHHNKIMVSEMMPGHITRLSDLQCLCANCHRILHRKLKIAD